MNNKLTPDITGNPPKISQRFFAFFIDTIFVYFHTFILWLSVKGQSWIDFNNFTTIMLFTVFFFQVYFIVFYYFNRGGTIGNIIFRIRIISANGKKMTFWQAWARSILLMCLVVPLLPLPLFLMHYLNLIGGSLFLLHKDPWRKQGRTVWDLGTKTITIKENP